MKLKKFKLFENDHKDIDPYDEEKWMSTLDGNRPKPGNITLPKTTEKTFYVDYDDFDEFVQQIYDESYEFAAIQEAGNDSSHEFGVTGDLDDYDEEDAQGIRNGVVRDNWLLFNVLCADGYIEPGNYIVRVSW